MYVKDRRIGLTISELARLAGESPAVVRYYCRIGLVKPARRASNGYRLFRDPDIGRLRFIRQAKSLGFSLAEIAQILADARRGKSPCPRVRDIVRGRIDENRKRLDDVTALQDRMEQALRRWERMPDRLPDGDSICHLIESAAKGDSR